MIKTFSEFLAEGGNIKVEGGSANPFPITVRNRQGRVDDIHGALSDMHDQYHKETGEHLFGHEKSGLMNRRTYAGSTTSLMDTKGIPHNEFANHISTVGDVDAQVSHEHKNNLGKFLFPGRKIGKYIVIGTKKHGNEVSAVMKHENGENHQFDFEGVHTDKNTGEPTEGERFLHGADWEDRKLGIKGMHHKVLLNAVGGDTHKFSITHGLRPRDSGKDDPGITEPHEVSSALFGPKADHSKVHSFHGIAQLIKKHVPAERHQQIYDKFVSSVEKMKGADHSKAIAHLGKTLGVQRSVNEEAEPEHHASVVPLTGFSPISHMGHAKDLGGSLSKLPGTKHVGISSKSDVYTPKERGDILSRQWGGKSKPSVHVVKSAGETVRAAHDSLPEGGRKVLHILVGHDRADFAHGLKKSLEAGKIKEMEGRKFDDIQIHHPEDTDRSHGMSGTNMRNAAAKGDVETFHRHLGPMFSKQEAARHMKKIKGALESGAIKVKR
jgi:hypothetical protein